MIKFITYQLLAFLWYNFMKEDELKSNQQKQMLINRLYKTKNSANVSKPLPKNDDDTKLLFYVRIFWIHSKRARNHLNKKKNSQRYNSFRGSPLAKNPVSNRTWVPIILVSYQPEGQVEEIPLLEWQEVINKSDKPTKENHLQKNLNCNPLKCSPYLQPFLKNIWSRLTTQFTIQKWPHSSKWCGRKSWLRMSLFTWSGSTQMIITTWKWSPTHKSSKIKLKITTLLAVRGWVSLWHRSQYNSLQFSNGSNK